jgi:hypothetical protein
MPKLYIAIFRPTEGNFHHWVLYLQSTPSKIFEVSGSHPDFARNFVQSDPESIDGHMESIEVGDVNEGDMSEFHSILDHVKDNEMVNGIVRTLFWKL